jgi:hypothetical protein
VFAHPAVETLDQRVRVGRVIGDRAWRTKPSMPS